MALSDKIKCVVDSHHGIYIPQLYCDNFIKYEMNRASNYHELIQEFEGCSDPGNENYWEDWDTILDKFWFLDGDVKYTLYQESDLFIVPDNLTEDERKELWGC